MNKVRIKVCNLALPLLYVIDKHMNLYAVCIEDAIVNAVMLVGTMKMQIGEGGFGRGQPLLRQTAA